MVSGFKGNCGSGCKPCGALRTAEVAGFSWQVAGSSVVGAAQFFGAAPSERADVRATIPGILSDQVAFTSHQLGIEHPHSGCTVHPWTVGLGGVGWQCSFALANKRWCMSAHQTQSQRKSSRPWGFLAHKTRHVYTRSLWRIGYSPVPGQMSDKNDQVLSENISEVMSKHTRTHTHVYIYIYQTILNNLP